MRPTQGSSSPRLNCPPTDKQWSQGRSTLVTTWLYRCVQSEYSYLNAYLLAWDPSSTHTHTLPDPGHTIRKLLFKCISTCRGPPPPNPHTPPHTFLLTPSTQSENSHLNAYLLAGEPTLQPPPPATFICFTNSPFLPHGPYMIHDLVER